MHIELHFKNKAIIITILSPPIEQMFSKCCNSASMERKSPLIHVPTANKLTPHQLRSCFSVQSDSKVSNIFALFCLDQEAKNMMNHIT